MDNLNKIIPFLVFNSRDDFYFLQIIKRKKENADLNSNSIVIKSYYIKSVIELEAKMPEIVLLCHFHNARAMINLNRKSFEKLAFQMILKVTNHLVNKEFKHIYKAYDSLVGSLKSDYPRWIVDIDSTDEDYISKIINYLTACEVILGIIPSKNGIHIITKPFRLDDFKYSYPGIDVHKNNPTNLYIPEKI